MFDEFEYAVNVGAPAVSLFRMVGDRWDFVRNCSQVSHAVAICGLENQYADEKVFVFPFGWKPDQIWNAMNRDAANA
jgi:hypothetical protein